MRRRTLIQSAATVLAGAPVLGACEPNPVVDPPPQSTTSTPPEKTDDNPFGVSEGSSLDIVLVDGAYGVDYSEPLLASYTSMWGPGAVVTATTDVAESLRGRLGNPTAPDLVQNAGTAALSAPGLVTRGQLADLGPLLEAPTVDDPEVTIRERLIPGVVDAGTYDGIFYALNYVLSVWGLWHSKSLFTERGWEPATTMDEFMSLCEAIRADEDRAPFIHPGADSRYMNAIITQQAVKHGGYDVLLKIDNLEPDAWTNDSILAAARAWEEVARAGYIAQDASDLDPLAAQTSWLKGDAAIMATGSWVEHEMRAEITDGFDMVLQPLPGLSAEDALPREALGGGASSPFVVPADAANRPGAMEFLRMMLSDEGIAAFTEATGNLCAVEGAAEAVRSPSLALQSVIDAVAAAGEHLIGFKAFEWYAELDAAAQEATAKLLSGEYTSDQYSAMMQAASDAVAANPEVVKFQRDL